jgi:hypothetical protein
MRKRDEIEKAHQELERVEKNYVENAEGGKGAEKENRVGKRGTSSRIIKRTSNNKIKYVQ